MRCTPSGSTDFALWRVAECGQGRPKGLQSGRIRFKSRHRLHRGSSAVLDGKRERTTSSRQTALEPSGLLLITPVVLHAQIPCWKVQTHCKMLMVQGVLEVTFLPRATTRVIGDTIRSEHHSSEHVSHTHTPLTTLLRHSRLAPRTCTYRHVRLGSNVTAGEPESTPNPAKDRP